MVFFVYIYIYIFIYIHISICFVFWLLCLPCKRLLFLFNNCFLFFICQVITLLLIFAFCVAGSTSHLNFQVSKFLDL